MGDNFQNSAFSSRYKKVLVTGANGQLGCEMRVVSQGQELLSITLLMLQNLMCVMNRL